MSAIFKSSHQGEKSPRTAIANRDLHEVASFSDLLFSTVFDAAKLAIAENV